MVDVSDMVIAPCREKKEKPVPPVGIFVLNPTEARRVADMGKCLNAENRFLFHSQLAVVPEGDKSNPFFVAGPAIGSPMAVMTLEKLIALGARRIIVTGWCGSLTPALEPKSILLPTWAQCEEGTSAHYPVSCRPESDSGLRTQLETYLNSNGFSAQSGPVWTTDALYRESREKVGHYGGQGIMAVEMEFSALATVAAFRGISLAAALIVSDSLWEKTWQPDFKNKEFRRMSSALLEALFTLAGTLGA